MATIPKARFWLALRSVPGIGDVTSRRLAERFGGPDRVLAASSDALRRGGVRDDVAREIAVFSGWSEIDCEIERAERLGIELLCLDDEGYPPALRFTHDPPPVLYVRGRLAAADVHAIAMVGSRKASAYGLAAAGRLARDLAAAGVTVVSGLALGIDAASHQGALDAGGRTLAVLGSGIDRIYPDRHRKLAERIAAEGALLSEFPLGREPAAENFPRRNRIVSGLALGVVVVEAGDKSGSLITARLALEQGREVLAVPGEIGLDRTRGTHRLLRQGARLVESGADVVDDVMPWLARSSAPPPVPSLAADASLVLGSFERPVEHVDRLIDKSGFSAARVLEILFELELAGRVSRHPGMTFSKRLG
ncbi:MAG: DNA-processing protein DprA [Candidatus Binatia bacterium]